MRRLAYFFDYDYADGRNPQDYLAPVTIAVSDWCQAQRSERRPALDAAADERGIVITDTRPVAVAEHHQPTGATARVYELCDTARTVAALLREPGLDLDEPQLLEILTTLVDRRLMLAAGGRYLGLAVFRSRRPTTEGARVEATAAA